LQKNETKNIEISGSPTAIDSMLHGYPRQRCTIGSLSATADLLVYTSYPLSRNLVTILKEATTSQTHNFIS